MNTTDSKQHEPSNEAERKSGLGIKVVKPKDQMPDEILGVITPTTNVKQYVQKIERYYGFPCAVFDA